MGCASSSPLITSNGGVLGAAKGAASDAVHAGEEAINEVKGALNDTVGQVKEAVVGAVHNVSHSLENAVHSNGSKGKDDSSKPNDGIQDIGVMNINSNAPESSVKETDYKIIPLKDPATKLLQKVDHYKDEADKMADDLMKETEDVIKEDVDKLETTVQHLMNDNTNNNTENSNNSVNKTSSNISSNNNNNNKNSDLDNNNKNSPTHSIDSLKTNTPEPEIEKALANNNDLNPPTPKPTIAELEQLQSACNTLVTTAQQNEANTTEPRLPPVPVDPTAWERLADSLVKPVPNRLHAYRETAGLNLTNDGSSSNDHHGNKDSERIILF